MLVLTRKLGEQIVIGDGVTVSIVAIQGNRVRIGINAPDSVSVRREELPIKSAHDELAVACSGSR